MKKTILSTIFVVAFLLFSINAFTQVGVGTTVPNGALDISNTTMGLVPPRVMLTATNVEAPVINPQGGSILPGTMIYNTNTTSGTYGVTPGLYFWDGSRWVSQYQRRFSQTYTQTSSNTYATGAGYTAINGLSSLSFTAPYDGVYQFIFAGHLGAVLTDDDTTNLTGTQDISGYAALGYVEGLFRVTIQSVDYEKYNYSMSYYRSSDGTDGTGGFDVYQLMNEVTLVINVTLNSGDVCNFGATYSPLGEDNVYDISGSHHIVGETIANLGNLCQLNVTYIGRD